MIIFLQKHHEKGYQYLFVKMHKNCHRIFTDLTGYSVGICEETCNM
ncbi:hypothetical protein B4110_1916 [Parageobacillus toebii]|uniref:Uncharacterized protein n=1 Tax=Parageobacillus toebii TaxID=153151 RepID=A0A150MR97_9BACL|nr:hypothetical protein B4110_1916 [Parageobacillus toebii]